MRSRRRACASRRSPTTGAWAPPRTTLTGSSQPWPFPANLIVGAFGFAAPDARIRLDLDNELQDAFFATRSEALAAVQYAEARARGTPRGGQPTRNDKPFLYVPRARAALTAVCRRRRRSPTSLLPAGPARRPRCGAKCSLCKSQTRANKRSANASFFPTYDAGQRRAPLALCVEGCVCVARVPQLTTQAPSLCRSRTCSRR